MLFSFLLASASTINITNRCINGAVDHEFLVTLKSNSDGRRLDTTQDKLSFLQGWVGEYTYSNSTTRRKLAANSTRVSNCTHILHFFTVTRLAVAVGVCDEVRRVPTARAHVESTTTPPPRRICTSLTAHCTRVPASDHRPHGRGPGHLLD